MNHFQYRDGQLYAEDVPLARIADDVGTPFYCYSTATIERHFKAYSEAFRGLNATICYAVKANGNIAVIRTLAELGAGADVVSGGELKRAIIAGIPAEKIVYSGVGKTWDEMAQALSAGVMQVNVESEPELELLSEVAQALDTTATIAIRINPDVDARTHAKITTGKQENKFGIEWTRAHEVCARAALMPGIEIGGLAVHIGSQISDLDPFRDSYVRLRDLVAMLRSDGHEIGCLDLGGGLGIPYGENADDEAEETYPTPADLAAVVRKTLGDLGCRLLLEPGRSIVGNAGVLVTRVVYVKEGAMRTFAIVDAGMNDLIRPTLYDAYHAIEPVTQPAAGATLREMDIVGPICETGDTFGTGRQMPSLKSDDLLAIRTAGAYGAVQASIYNARALVPEVLVRGGDFGIVRERISVDDFIAREPFPQWFSDPT
ncbi:MAG: diaminopimelate decarboxylase [Rhodospirillales bacterium]|nr:diaminopimelate decarboxylase [Rhodospirillales bacterium]